MWIGHDVLLTNSSALLWWSAPELFAFCHFSALFPNESTAIGNLHYGIFLLAMQSLCSEEQKARWLKKAHNMEIIGTYAQTEIGHGSYIVLLL